MNRKRFWLWLSFGLFVSLPSIALAQPGVDLPTPGVTPGWPVWSDDLDTVCNTYTYTRRRTTSSMKEEAYSKYGINFHLPGQYQIDHLVPLCLGGADSQENLWPQSYDNPAWNAKKKDELERVICRMVCDHRYPLADAQTKIRENWIDFYEEIIGVQSDNSSDDYCEVDDDDDCG
jgi:hypothetical protein